MFLGYFIGVVFGGVLGDKFGRKPVIYFMFCLNNIAALAASFAQAYWVYVLFRVLVGFFIGELIRIFFKFFLFWTNVKDSLNQFDLREANTLCKTLTFMLRNNEQSSRIR